MTLACQNITLSVAGRILCRNLAFTIKSGEVWGVLGPNGSGKTTLLNVLAGVASPLEGWVSVDAQPLTRIAADARARAIGLLPQHEAADFWGTALEYVRLGCHAHSQSWFGWQASDETAARSSLQQTGVEAFSSRRYATLSGGERQRVRIAQLLAQEPRFLLLDEPLQHLDLSFQGQMLGILSKLATTAQRGVVVVLHDVLWPARYCTHALLLDGKGGVIAGTAGEVLTQKNLETLFCCNLQPAGDNPRAGFVPAL